MVNVLVRNDNDVASLQSAIQHGAVSLKTIPELVKGILRNEEWRERALAGTGEIVEFRTFSAFVTADYPQGLGTTVKTLQRLCNDAPDVLDLIDQALQNPAGIHAVSNIHSIPRPSGTTEQRALRKLRKDRPDLHAQVLAGEASAHGAMVAAGFRPKTITVRADAEAFARAARRHLSTDELARLVALLNGEAT